MRGVLFLVLMICCPATWGQTSRALDGVVYTLQVRSSCDIFGVPIIALGSDEYVDIDFDLLTHEYQRLTYRIEHCNADWTVTQGLFDSDYLEGYDGQPIDDYETSVNTSVLYTHYHLRLPNEDVSMRLSGNYRVAICDEDEEAIAYALFSVVESALSISAGINTRTDRDINGRHQQLDVEVGYGSLNLVDPESELRMVVMQNRRYDNVAYDVRPSIVGPTSMTYTHNADLVFDAGNECHKFELIDKRGAIMGIDHIEYHAPYEHAVLEPVLPARTYNYEDDYNGVFVIRDRYGEDADTRAEYLFFHFALITEPLPEGEHLYVQGDLTNGRLLPEFEMQYDEVLGGYTLSVLLKQGYYEYRFVHATSPEGVARTSLTEGDFYETCNEYMIFVYHRAPGARYDRLVATRMIGF